ncbi:hypothetical protein AB4Z52_13680 [Rhizobium sp. 2YAF20]|uniref:hypothetical protein n=1 Tax=Rhizobium sp. 2YAF20 TaxID=3233027 RepID=UPI003F955DC0
MTETPTSNDFREHLRLTREQELHQIKRLAYEYLRDSACLAKEERLDFRRRKEFFMPHFRHLSGITRAYIVSQCVLRVSDLFFAELRARQEAECRR